MKIYIKYMVSLRCKMFVKSTLDDLCIHYSTVDLGEVVLKEKATIQQTENLRIALLGSGLELMDDCKSMLIERIKNIIVEMVHYQEEIPKTNFSEYLSEKLHYNYTHLAHLFSDVAGTTIENYIISHKIERAKELLLYDELSLTEIAWKLHYSSVSHLSNQFKRITGLTPTYFKKIKLYKKRIELEMV